MNHVLVFLCAFFSISVMAEPKSPVLTIRAAQTSKKVGEVFAENCNDKAVKVELFKDVTYRCTIVQVNNSKRLLFALFQGKSELTTVSAELRFPMLQPSHVTVPFGSQKLELTF